MIELLTISAAMLLDSSLHNTASHKHPLLEKWQQACGSVVQRDHVTGDTLDKPKMKNWRLISRQIIKNELFTSKVTNDELKTVPQEPSQDHGAKVKHFWESDIFRSAYASSYAETQNTDISAEIELYLDEENSAYITSIVTLESKKLNLSDYIKTCRTLSIRSDPKDTKALSEFLMNGLGKPKDIRVASERMSIDWKLDSQSNFMNLRKSPDFSYVSYTSGVLENSTAIEILFDIPVK
jgi:hypothetical protein